MFKGVPKVRLNLHALHAQCLVDTRTGSIGTLRHLKWGDLKVDGDYHQPHDCWLHI